MKKANELFEKRKEEIVAALCDSRRTRCGFETARDGHDNQVK